MSETTIRTIPTTEVAKLVRRELRIAFPGVHFSVRTKWFGLRESIVVRWSARAPSRAAVRAAVGHLSGAQTDGLDGWQYVPIVLPNGERVQLGNTSIMLESEVES